MAGRAIPPPRFPGDTGAADPELARSLQLDPNDPRRPDAVLAALRSARLLVPVAALGEHASPGSPKQTRQEQGSEMAVVTLGGTDGRLALPAFSGLASLHRWDPAARPVPLPAARVAQAALAEDASVLVIDVAGPAPYLVQGNALHRLARGLGATCDHRALAAAVREVLSEEPAVRRAYLLPSDVADARLALVLAAGASPATAVSTATGIAQRLSDSESVRAAVVRGLDLALVPEAVAAGAPEPAFYRAPEAPGPAVVPVSAPERMPGPTAPPEL